ncbi:hypothetical protein ZOSMA_62G00080 [Zostera marina]|uniref:Uncharacterized protein n=1 Tax=Zostera marina TaxID=29655 RepID=A0A0K9NTK9_ZOSMR|nr:hypothetical protein ZOSMA_62G00080 [Zostera marina]
MCIYITNFNKFGEINLIDLRNKPVKPQIQIQRLQYKSLVGKINPTIKDYLLSMGYGVLKMLDDGEES